MQVSEWVHSRQEQDEWRIKELMFQAISGTVSVSLHLHVVCNSLLLKGWHLRHFDRHRSVWTVSHRPDTAPAKRTLPVYLFLCLSHGLLSVSASSCHWDVCAVLAWWCAGSKCDCLIIILLDFAVKWERIPSNVFGTDWQWLRISKFQASHSCCTRCWGYWMPWCWFISKSGSYVCLFFLSYQSVLFGCRFMIYIYNVPSALGLYIPCA